MKNLLLAATAALTLALGGCNSELTAEQVALIQGYTQAACGFLPTAVAIANVASGNSQVVIPATQIASAICDAVTKQSGGKRSLGTSKTVTVSTQGYTFEVTGKFVR